MIFFGNQDEKIKAVTKFWQNNALKILGGSFKD